MELIEFLIKEKKLKTSEIIEAFSKIKREDFIPDGFKHLSNLDQPLPIGHNQTISQPQVVAFMLEKLQPKPGEKILDIGAGSGWTSALLAEIVSQKKGGQVIAVELIPEIADFGQNNLKKYSFIKKGIVKFINDSAFKGYSKYAPYDKILVSASAPEIFPEWQEQIKENGIIVASVKNSIFVIDKNKEQEYYGFSFVPLKE